MLFFTADNNTKLWAVVAGPNQPPGGTDNTVWTRPNTAYTLAVSDFGFTDPDVPPNAFSRVRITTLPTVGTLTLNGLRGRGRFRCGAGHRRGQTDIPARDRHLRNALHFVHLPGGGQRRHGQRRKRPRSLPKTMTISVTDSDLVTHYDASAILGVSDGDAVDRWADVSGYGDDLRGNRTALGRRADMSPPGSGAWLSVDFNDGDGYQSNDSMGAEFQISGDAAWTTVWVARVEELPYSGPIRALGENNGEHGLASLELQSECLALSDNCGNDLVLAPDNSFDDLVGKDLMITVTHEGNTGGFEGTRPDCSSTAGNRSKDCLRESTSISPATRARHRCHSRTIRSLSGQLPAAAFMG